jgi:hypothetical protein
LLGVEVRRALHRRVVWTLIALALTGCAVTGVIAFITSRGMTSLEVVTGHHPAAMATWWDFNEDGALGTAAILLLLGGLFGGASVIGAEWRAGTITTLLTWEPRRVKAHLTRLGACAACAIAISALLQAVFLMALLPAVLTNGSTTGIDGAWWAGLAATVTRVSLVTGAAAVIGASFATLGRNTAFGVMVVAGWLMVGESIVRSLRPSFARHFLAENIGTVVPWASLGQSGANRSPGGAAIALVLYTGLAVVAGLVSFTRRDVTGAT